MLPGLWQASAGGVPRWRPRWGFPGAEEGGLGRCPPGRKPRTATAPARSPRITPRRRAGSALGAALSHRWAPSGRGNICSQGARWGLVVLKSNGSRPDSCPFAIVCWHACLSPSEHFIWSGNLAGRLRLAQLRQGQGASAEAPDFGEAGRRPEFPAFLCVCGCPLPPSSVLGPWGSQRRL